MNYVKTQQEIMKSWAEPEPCIRIGKYKRPEDDAVCIAVITNSDTLLRLIREEDFMLDYKRMTKEFIELDSIHRLFGTKSTRSTKAGALSGMTRKKGTHTYVEIKGEPGSSVWVNQKLLTSFDKDAVYYIGRPTDAVIVKENGVTVGLVMPFKMQEDTRA